ncbi:hypothetical protein [Kutzneria sp. CA-103260]|uniref:hypothetical protein n=1 Tax=Kutzneria sp. CA-103260 TaxID=2802641 RepID=UPI001BAA8758|nr:hypothetical protein [Kutzneria sp. CA-103260]QUQ65701.1 hypothetical protein JJ691_34250 [Kutzneria sp. CA-103260]
MWKPLNIVLGLAFALLAVSTVTQAQVATHPSATVAMADSGGPQGGTEGGEWPPL